MRYNIMTKKELKKAINTITNNMYKDGKQATNYNELLRERQNLYLMLCNAK